jgi:Tfp pilus assembly protein PilX
MIWQETNMHPFSLLNNQRGSALIIALLMLVVLTLLGISATTTSTVELQISGNDKLYKRSFFAADGGTAAGSELVEQNIEDRDWTDDSPRGNVAILNGDFYLNRDTDAGIDPVPSDTNQDLVIPLSAIVDENLDGEKGKGQEEEAPGSSLTSGLSIAMSATRQSWSALAGDT